MDPMKRRQVISTLIGIHLAAWAAGPAAGHVHRSYQAPRRLLGADQKSVLQKPDMHRSCGHVPPTADERLRRMAELAPFRAKAEAAVRRRTLLQGGIVIRTFWHVNRLGGDGDTADGDVPASMLAAQMQVLNTAFAPLGMSFVVAGIEKFSNASWWNIAAPSPELDEMKTAKYTGTFADLNIYITMMQDNLLGYTSQPFATNGVVQPLDGMVINPYSLPGGAYPGFNGGMSVVHEAGHWLSLYHPFVDGCSEPNDLIDDTPEMAQPVYECTATNSCPGRPASQGEQDPIHNYMGYTPDSCMNQFTADQSATALAAWQAYRAPYAVAAPVSPSPTTSTAPSPSPLPSPSPAAPVAASAAADPAPTPESSPSPQPAVVSSSDPAPTTPQPVLPSPSPVASPSPSTDAQASPGPALVGSGGAAQSGTPGPDSTASLSPSPVSELSP